MYIVNTSFVVDASVHDRWLEFVKGKYIPHLKENGFGLLAFTRVISNDTPGSFTYSLQVDIPDMGGYKKLTEEIFAEYIDVAVPLFGDKVLWFTSLLKHV